MNDPVRDPIVEEVRAARAKIAEECGYDLRRMLEHANEAASKVPGLRYVTAEEMKARRAGRQAAPAAAPGTSTAP